jgi:membrane-bound ClpP family serine protease
MMMDLMMMLAQATPPTAPTAGAEPSDMYLIWGGLLVAAALVLFMAELFVPSGGLIGVLAGVAAIGSVVSFFMYDETIGFVSLALYIVLGPVVVVSGFKLWLHSPLGKSMVLGGTTTVDEAGDSPDQLTGTEIARMQRTEKLRALIGVEGKTVTGLRPVGVVKIEGQRIDALAESGIIDANTRVVVTEVYDNQIKVRPVDAEA